MSNAKYGDQRQVLDLRKAKSDRPTPLGTYIHGGAFQAGGKSTADAGPLAKCLDAGLSVAAITYRFSQHASFPAPMNDAARAVQFLRSKAGAWDLDPRRFGATGVAAGAGISLWLAFHHDQADPRCADPVARQFTRLSCAAVLGAQSSYDPRWIKEKIGAAPTTGLAPVYGLKTDEADTPKAHAPYDAAAPIKYVTGDDPPVFLFDNEPKGPLPADARLGQGIHHPTFGEALKQALDPLTIECVLRHQDDSAGKPDWGGALIREMVGFFVKHLQK